MPFKGVPVRARPRVLGILCRLFIYKHLQRIFYFFRYISLMVVSECICWVPVIGSCLFSSASSSCLILFCLSQTCHSIKASSSNLSFRFLSVSPKHNKRIIAKGRAKKLKTIHPFSFRPLLLATDATTAQEPIRKAKKTMINKTNNSAGALLVNIIVLV